MAYWIIKDGKRTGPVGYDELRRLGVASDTKVWKEGLDNWTPAKDVPELQDIIPPPIPDEPEEEQLPPALPEDDRQYPSSWLPLSVVLSAASLLFWFLTKGSKDIEGPDLLILLFPPVASVLLAPLFSIFCKIFTRKRNYRAATIMARWAKACDIMLIVMLSVCLFVYLCTL